MTPTSQFPSGKSLEFIRRQASDAEALIEQAVQFVRARLTAEPSFFGVTQYQADALLTLPMADFPLDQPELIFYPDGSWMVRFQEGRLPICDPYGLGVMFIGLEPTDIEDLSNAEPI